MASIVSDFRPRLDGLASMIRPDEATICPSGRSTPDRVEPGVLVPGLVPGDERRVLPAPVVDVGEDRIPVQEVRHPLVLAPPAPLVGQLDSEVDLRRDRSAGRDRLGPAGAS